MNERAIPAAIVSVLLLAITAASSAARAADAEEPIRLDYAAVPECESRDDLVRNIVKRAPGARLVEDGESSRRFGVRIVREGSLFRADLVIRGVDGSPVARRLSTETCEQATRALALTIALSIDPHASASDADRSATSLAPGVTGNAVPSDAVPVPVAPSAPDAAPKARTSSPGRRGWALSLGADADALLLISSQPVVALGGHLELGRERGPALRASFKRSFSQTVSTQSLGGHFDWVWGRLDGCPLRFGGGVEVGPCVFAEVGEVHAEGFGGTSSVRRSRPWATVGVLARVGAHLHGLTGSVDLGLASSINRESFVFLPSPVVYAIPAWVPSAGISLGGEWSL